MKKLNLMAKITVATLLLSLLLPAFVSPLASTIKPGCEDYFIKPKHLTSGELQKLVEEKIITQEQADKIKEYLKKRLEEKRKK